MYKLLVLLGLFSSGLYASDDAAPLIVQMQDPNVRITVPGMSHLDMGVDPMNEHKPNFRLLGTNGKTAVSIITPDIGGVVSPTACATAVANSVLALGRIERDQIFLGRANEHTFLIIYGMPLTESVMLNAHIVSSAGSEICIEAHVSKISTSDADIEPWFNGFVDATIEAS
jgi:hypothetical protein